MTSNPDIWEITSICRNKEETLRWLIQQNVFYNTTTGFGIMVCRSGEQMNIVSSGVRGLTWQCPKKNCCNRSKKSLRTESFFYNLKAPV
ncbi:hypothetical protein BCR42DRAFT_426654, partial [Absidia repens]